MKIIFAGTPDFAKVHLQAIIDAGHEVCAVYTQPDRPAGRGKKLQASPVKKLALELGIEVLQPKSLKKPEAQAQLASLEPDLMVVVAYGLILPKAVLDIPKHGCINVHGSLLPRWRGAAPIQRAIWAGDATTGITTMLMDEGLDTGAMLLKAEIAIGAGDTSASLYAKLEQLGPKTLVETLAKLPSLEPEVQNDDEANYAKKLSKEEAQIDWRQPAIQIERNIRAFDPWPGTFFPYQGKNIKVKKASICDGHGAATPGEVVSVDKTGITVQTADAALLLETLQLPGKKAMPVADILNGNANWLVAGTQLGSDDAKAN